MKKREAILDSVNRLIYSKGYEQMTTQDILDDLQISRGAFYHYFKTKEDVIVALIERVGNELNKHIHPVVTDRKLTAIEKLKGFFAAIAEWKDNRKDVLIEMARSWYSNDNTLIRDKFRRDRKRQLAPLIATIIAQGCKENVFETKYPNQMGEMIVCLVLELNESIAEDLLQISRGQGSVESLHNTIAVYNQSLIRMLGCASDSLQLIDADKITRMITEWFINPESN